MTKKLVVGNWKMHGSIATVRELAVELRQGLDSVPDTVGIIIAPSFLHIETVSNALRGTRPLMAAQNVSEHVDGAYTGEVSCSMLSDIGISHVIVGHSERRSQFAEGNGTVAEKFAAAYDAGLVPILCVGETLAQRHAGQTEEVVLEQLQAVLDRVGVKPLARSPIAYEPVWAIGTGKTASPEQAQEVHAMLRNRLHSVTDAPEDTGAAILYGGSVNATNCAALFTQPDIDGVLVGGASLKAQEFLKICRIAAE